MDESTVPCGNCDKGMVRDRFGTWVVCPMCNGRRFYPLKALPDQEVCLGGHEGAKTWCWPGPIWTQADIDHENGITRD